MDTGGSNLSCEMHRWSGGSDGSDGCVLLSSPYIFILSEKRRPSVSSHIFGGFKLVAPSKYSSVREV
jgi:hypothetical protein